MAKLNLGDPYEGLMHDAQEAYLGDLSSPIKSVLPDYQELERKVEVALRGHFDLPLAKSAGCKKADWLALFVEAYFLLPSKGESFADPNGLRPEALALLNGEEGIQLLFMEPTQAKLAFTTTYYELRYTDHNC